MKSRRAFIKHAGLATAGSLIIPGCGTGAKETSAAATRSAEPAVLKAKWDIGLQLYTLRNQIAEDLPGTIAKVSEIGYKHVELFGYGDRKYFGMPAQDFYKLLIDNGLGISSSHHLTGRVGGDSQGTLLNGWEQTVEDALVAGQTHIVCPYLLDEERESLDDYKELTDILNKAGETCKKAGIGFGYHNHAFEFEPMEGQIPMDVIMNGTDPDLVQMELDIYWVYKAGGTAQDFFEKYPGRTTMWHVKDLGEDGATVAVGNGVIDYKTIFAAAGESGLQKFFVEQDNSDDPLTDIATSLQTVTEILA